MRLGHLVMRVRGVVLAFGVVIAAMFPLAVAPAGAADAGAGSTDGAGVTTPFSEMTPEERAAWEQRMRDRIEAGKNENAEERSEAQMARVVAARKARYAEFPPENCPEATERAAESTGLERTLNNGWREYFLPHYDDAFTLWHAVIAGVDDVFRTAAAALPAADVDKMADLGITEPAAQVAMYFGKFRYSVPDKTTSEAWEDFAERYETAYQVSLTEEHLDQLILAGKAWHAMGVTEFRAGHFPPSEDWFRLASKVYSFAGFRGEDCFGPADVFATEGTFRTIIKSSRLQWCDYTPRELLWCATLMNDTLKQLQYFEINDGGETPVMRVWYDWESPRARFLYEHQQDVISIFRQVRDRFYIGVDEEHLRGTNIILLSDWEQVKLVGSAVDPWHHNVGGFFHNAKTMVMHNPAGAEASRNVYINGKPNGMWFLRAYMHCALGHNVQYLLRPSGLINSPSLEGWPEALRFPVLLPGYNVPVDGRHYFHQAVDSIADRRRPLTFWESRDITKRDSNLFGDFDMARYEQSSLFHLYLLMRGNPQTGVDGYTCMNQWMAALNEYEKITAASAHLIDIYGLPAEVAPTRENPDAPMEFLFNELFDRRDWADYLTWMAYEHFGW